MGKFVFPHVAIFVMACVFGRGVDYWNIAL